MVFALATNTVDGIQNVQAGFWDHSVATTNAHTIVHHYTLCLKGD